MPGFAEFIAESFHSEACVTWKLQSTSHAIASFIVNGVAAEVSFEQREPGGPWPVAFTVARVEPAERAVVSAFRIFNGVFQAVREFIETRQPEIVVFISKDEDLAGIYETYLRRERSAIETLGYRLEGPDRVDPYTQFTLRRIAPSAWTDQ
jgi:hypothetical protein